MSTLRIVTIFLGMNSVDLAFASENPLYKTILLGFCDANMLEKPPSFSFC